ncbi:MAG: F0F1 ATP synthase subunit B [Candidatus Pacebacteria bacterium]|nr:F0F1 ATP synthase subunit B [Candidatus Paceibacterota bacterium]
MEGLGINWKILVGQLINFAILLYVLKRFAYKPFFNVLEKRRQKIEEGVKKSVEAEKTLQETRSLSEKIKKSGEEEARRAFKEVEERANVKAGTIVAAAEEEKKKMITAAQKLLEEEKKRQKETQKNEAKELAVFLSEKILGEKIDLKKDQKLIEGILADLK